MFSLPIIPMFLYFCFFLLSPVTRLPQLPLLICPLRRGPEIMWLEQQICKCVWVTPGQHSSQRWGSSGPYSLELKWVFCITCWILFLCITSDPFCKVNWELAFFKLTAGNWPLCSRYVRKGLDEEQVRRQNGNTPALIVTVMLLYKVTWAQIPLCDPVATGPAGLSPYRTKPPIRKSCFSSQYTLMTQKCSSL